MYIFRPGYQVCHKVNLINYPGNIHISRDARKRSSGFLTRSDTKRAVQSQKMARELKFCIKVVEGLYYLYSENKGADQLHGYREADLRLCFRKCKNPVFSRRGSYYVMHISLMLSSDSLFKTDYSLKTIENCSKK